MLDGLSGKQAALLAISMISTLIGVPTLLFFKQPTFAFNILLIGFILSFLMIIEIRQIRLMKGFVIILFGIFFGTIYSKLFMSVSDPGILEAGLRQNLEIFSNLAIYACAGAGGSIIAAHADKNSKDRDNVAISQTVIDRTQDIIELKKSVDCLNKKMTTIFLALTILLLGIVIILFNK